MKKVLGLVTVIVVLIICTTIIVIQNKEKEDSSSTPNQNGSRTTTTEENIAFQPTPSDETYNNNSEKELSENKKILYFFNNSFVGYFQNNKWNAPKDIKLSELFDNEYFTYYDSDKEKKTANQMHLRLGFGYGGFAYEGMNLEDDVDLNLTKYCSSQDKGIYKIPNKLNAQLNDTYTKDLGDAEISSVVVFSGDIKDNYEGNFISYNANYDLKFAEESSIDNLPKDVEDYLINLLEEKGLNKDIQYKVVQNFNCDLNNNGIEDEVFSIISSDVYTLNDEQTKGDIDEVDKLIKDNGAFSIIIAKVDDKISTIIDQFISIDYAKESEYTMVGSTENRNVYVVDLNEDGIYEMLHSLTGWEYYWNYLSVFNGESYDTLKSTII